MDSGKIYFIDNSPLVDFFLTKGEIRDIIAVEYGIRPKRQRIIRKYLKRLLNDLLDYLLEDKWVKKWN